MPRKPKISTPETQESASSAFPVVTFNNQSFEIHPISDRQDDGAYDDAAQFLILGIPTGSKVFSELLRVSKDNPTAIERIAKGASDESGMLSVAMDLVDIVSKSDIEGLLDDLSDVLPKLAAIACHYTDPTVTARDVRNWTKSPINPAMWTAVVQQFKADKLMEQIAALQGVVGEFVGGAQ